MTSEVHPSEPDPPADLVAAARRVVPGWLRRVTVAAAARGGVAFGGDDDELERMLAATSDELVGELDALLRTDVDAQRTNPLSLFRAAVAAPTALLRARGVPPPATTATDAGWFPDDVYRLGPSTWADVDPALHEPGLAWGAWKAMTVLRRRRDEGLR